MLKNIAVSKNARARHVTRGFHLKCRDVEAGIANCALAWVEYGKTFRDLTPAEAIAARNERAQNREIGPLGKIYEKSPHR